MPLKKDGFTMFEAILVVTLMAVIVVAMAPLFGAVFSGWQLKDRQLEIMQNARVAMDEITRQIKRVDYFSAIGTSSMEFLTFNGGRCGFRQTGTNLEKLFDFTYFTSWGALAGPLHSLEFVYIDRIGVGTLDPAEVRTVKVTMNIYDTEDIVNSITFKTSVTPRRDYYVAINEIYYHPIPPESDNDEWIELYNTGSFPVDINGWRVVNSYNTSESDTISAYSGGSTVIQPGGFAIVAASDAVLSGFSCPENTIKVKAGSDQTFWSSGLGDSGGIDLKDQNNVTISGQGYSSSLGGDGNGESIERRNSTTWEGGSDSGNWEDGALTGDSTMGEPNTTINTPS